MYADEPARSVSLAAIRPPVHDSATATVRTGGPKRSRATISSTVAPSREKTRSPWRSSSAASNSEYAEPADEGNVVAISSSPRRRHVVTSKAPSTDSARSVRASSDSGSPVIRINRVSKAEPPASKSATAGTDTAAPHIGCSSRGGPGSTSTSGRPGTTRPGAVPTGSSTAAPAGTSACLRAPSRSPSSLTSRQRSRSPETTPQIRSSSAASTAIGRPATDATTSAVRSSAVGPSPPLVTTRSIPASARNRRAAERSSSRSPTTMTCATSTPRERNSPDSHGPFSSRTNPESTSVPVTTMPARTLTPSSPAARRPTAVAGGAPAAARTPRDRRWLRPRTAAR